MELQPKFGQIIHKTKSTYYNTATPRLQFCFSVCVCGQIIHKTKSTYYNTATPRLQWNYSQNLVKLYRRQSLHTTTQLLQGSRELEPKFSQIIHKTKSTYYNTATPRLQWKYSRNLVKLYTRQSLHTTTQLLQGSSGTTAKVWSNYTQDKAYTLQHSYFKAPVKLEPKFGQIIHKTKFTYYNTATSRLQGTRARIWSNYTQDKVYILQHSYSKAPGN